MGTEAKQANIGKSWGKACASGFAREKSLVVFLVTPHRMKARTSNGSGSSAGRGVCMTSSGMLSSSDWSSSKSSSSSSISSSVSRTSHAETASVHVSHQQCVCVCVYVRMPVCVRVRVCVCVQRMALHAFFPFYLLPQLHSHWLIQQHCSLRATTHIGACRCCHAISAS